jgi:hypothetical protein
MHDLTYIANFYKDKILSYRAVMFAGYIGVFTAIKPGKFAISINQRNSGTFFGVGVNLIRWLGKSHSPASLLAMTAEHANSYQEAQEMLATISLTAPVYLTLSGVNENEGSIITRDRTGAADIWLINKDSPTDWCIVQTNFDHWITPPPSSDKNRSNSAKRALKNISKAYLTKNNLMSQVLQNSPVFNSGTIYSTVMSAKIDLFETTRYI